MVYLKLFNRDVKYSDYVNDSGIIRPNVSHCVSEGHIHYEDDKINGGTSKPPFSWDTINSGWTMPDPIIRPH